MATCANCIHHSLCDYNTNISGNGKVRLVYSDGADVKCSFFQNTADVVPKIEVEELKAIIADHKESEERLEELYSNAKSEYDNLKMQFDALDCECGRLEKAESEKYDRIIETKRACEEIFEELARKSTYVFPTMLYTIAKRDVDELKKKYIGE